MEKRNVPKLRFPGFEGEWEVEQAGNLGSTYAGLSGKSGSDFGSGKPYIQYKQIFDDSSVDLNRIGYVNVSVAERQNKVEYGDIFFTTSSETPNEVGMASTLLEYIEEAYLNSFCFGYRINSPKEFKPYFARYLFHCPQFRKSIVSLAQGSTRYNISKAQFLKLELRIPVDKEQQKIASFLTAVDEKITHLKDRKARLESYKKATMQQLFSQQLRFKQEDGSDFPEWEEFPLNEIAARRTKKNTDSVIKTVFTNSAVQGIVNQQDYFDKDIANQGNLQGYLIVDKDDFVYNPRISVSAPVGPIKRNHLDVGVMSPLYTVFNIREGNLTFYEKYFETGLWHDYMKSIANYGVRFDRMNISTIGFYNMPVPVPSLAEQTKIARFLSAIDEKIALCSAQLEKTEQWKKGLLQQLFV